MLNEWEVLDAELDGETFDDANVPAWDLDAYIALPYATDRYSGQPIW